MTKIISKASDLTQTNAVFYIQTKKDIDEITKIFSVDNNIEKKILATIKEKKDTFLQFYIGSKKLDNLFVYFSGEKTKKERQLFLGKHTSQLPDEITLFCLDAELSADMIDTCILSRYCYEVYKQKKSKKKTTLFTNKKTQEIAKQRLELVDNISLARDLGEMPSNHLTPEGFVKIVKNTTFKNTKVTILDSKQIQKQGLGLIHAVGKGSENKPYMVILERIVDKKNPTIGLIGKGITFDTGGIQVKPENSMYEMKGDMGGAAVTLATMKELDSKKLNTNIVACLCLAENSISSTSYKPSDIITGYAGKTVEVIHTDAEGRLVLADGISYISKNYKTDQLITIATLTGACMVALGYRYAGVMGTNKKFIDKILQYSKNNSEQYVELPFDDHFLEKTKSSIADYKNLDRGVYAGSSMGGAFLYNFLENKELYTHIDIAGAYLNGEEAYGKVNKGATGFGVESLSEIIGSL